MSETNRWNKNEIYTFKMNNYNNSYNIIHIIIFYKFIGYEHSFTIDYD